MIQKRRGTAAFDPLAQGVVLALLAAAVWAASAWSSPTARTAARATAHQSLQAEACAGLPLSQLPISFPIQTEEAAAFFNRIARPGDTATFPAPYLNLLPQVTAGRRSVGFRSWQQAQNELPALRGQIELFSYNPEHWEHTPQEEQQNLAATVHQAAEFARANDLEFIFVPDRRFAMTHLDDTAAFADRIIIQAQRLQQDQVAFVGLVEELAATARAASPDVQLFVQVSAARGTAAEMVNALAPVADQIDGISIWTIPRSQAVLEEFVHFLRCGSEVVESPTSMPAAATARPSSSTVQGAAPEASIPFLGLGIALVAGGVFVGFLLGRFVRPGKGAGKG